MQDMLAAALNRMELIEANEARRAAKDARNYVTRLDVFYAKHWQTVAEAIRGPLTVLRLAGGGNRKAAFDQDLAATVNEHVAGKRAALLAAAEWPPAELLGRVAECVKDWGKHSG